MKKHVLNLKWAVVLSAILVLFAGLKDVSAADANRMVLILDASGSMWGQIEGKAKIQIAKEVMAELVEQIPTEFHTGLMVYGHRRKGDCQDIEMMIPVGPHDASAMKAKVNAIQPKGKTPLSEAVRQAAEALRYTEERATVVLVSDGLETCDMDPCALAAELARTGVEFTVHVIGFDISKEDQGRLRCLADRTGGLFLAADNAASLRDALFKTVEEVKAPPPPVVEDPGTAVLKGPKSVPAGASFTVQWEGPDSRGDHVGIAKKGSKDLNLKDYAYTKRGNPSSLTAPGDAGPYELRYIHSASRKVIGRVDIEVTPVEAKVQAPPSADAASEFEVSWQGPGYNSDHIAIARPDQNPASKIYYTYTRSGNPLKLQAPAEPGTYEVRYILGQDHKLLAKTTIEIKGVGAKVSPPTTAQANTEFEVPWEGPGYQSDYIAIARPDQNPASKIHYTYTRSGNPVKIRAPKEPGTYEVRYILGLGGKILDKATISVK
jgi:Ca-activated chloride channel family protein